MSIELKKKLHYKSVEISQMRPEETVNYSQAARILGLNVETVKGYVWRRKLKPYKNPANLRATVLARADVETLKAYRELVTKSI